MFTLLDNTCTLQTKYRWLEPKLMGKDKDFVYFGPYTVAATLQEEHGKLIADSDWTTLATKLPELNTLVVQSERQDAVGIVVKY